MTIEKFGSSLFQVGKTIIQSARFKKNETSLLLFFVFFQINAQFFDFLRYSTEIKKLRGVFVGLEEMDVLVFRVKNSGWCRHPCREIIMSSIAHSK